MKIVFLSILFYLSSLSIFGQSLGGNIKDKDSKENLAFVNIILKKNQGVVSDIKGNFSIDHIQKGDSLKISYVGYYDTLIVFDGIKKHLRIELTKKTFSLNEVEVKAGKNPAHRLINLLIENAQYNNPKNLESYSYMAYHKTIVTADTIGINKPRESMESMDSSEIKLMEFMEKQHLFITENISKTKYKKPDLQNEEILASKISGLKNPYFVILATQMQTFSFYQDVISLAGKNYISPVNKTSMKKYFFQIKDTVFHGKDSVFIIQFRPRINTNFEGLKGVLYINSDKYALSNLIVSPADESQNFTIETRQQFEKVGEHWFPVQMSSIIKFLSISINENPALAVSNSYLKNIEINPELKNSDFDNVVLKINKNASNHNLSLWDYYRNDSLSEKELKTYYVIDSISHKNQLERKIQSLIILSKGQIPFGKFGIDLGKFYDFNRFEKFRLGIGLSSNERFSEIIKLSAYSAYAFGDKKWKYGGDFSLNFEKLKDLEFKLIFKNDVEESAKISRFEQSKFLDNYAIRSYLIKKMVYEESLGAEIKIKDFKHFNFTFSANYSAIENADDYKLALKYDNINLLLSNFSFFESSIGSRFMFKEKIIKTHNAKYSLGSKFPIVNFKYTFSKNMNIDKVSDFNSYEIKIEKDFYTKFIGKSSVILKAAYIDNENIPWYKLYNGNGAYTKFYFAFDEYFNTMRMNEFLSSRYIYLFLNHDFEKLIINRSKFSPEFKIATNIAWGDLEKTSIHKNLNFKTLDKFYFESGLQINNIFSSSISSVGLGIYYRYGAYQLDKLTDNFAIRFTSSFNF